MAQKMPSFGLANPTLLRAKSCNETRPSPSRAEASGLSPRTPHRDADPARKTDLSWLDRGWPVIRSPFFEPIHTQSIRHSPGDA
jgi:hypothetical protein